MTSTPAMASVTTSYGPAYAPPAQVPYGSAPAYGADGAPTPQPTPPPPSPGGSPDGGKRKTIGRIAMLVAAILIAGLVGGILGAVIVSRTSTNPAPVDQPVAPTYSASTIQAQNIQLCTAYATINSSMPKPAENALDVLPGANGMRLALSETPAASPEIRTAISDVVSEFDALIASFGNVRTRGLAQPPAYDGGKAQAAFDRAWDVCQLG